MTALGQWLKQLVLVVLLAGITDMILPSKTMQRYVRVVMGLAVIAMMLQPILPFFQRDWAERAANLAVQELSGAETNGHSGLSGLPGIQQNLQDEQSRETDVLLASQLAKQIQTQFHCQVDQVVVSGALQGGSALRVDVRLQSGRDRMADIRRFVAEELGVSLGQVQVQLTGA